MTIKPNQRSFRLLKSRSDKSSPPTRATIKLNVTEAAEQSGLLLFVLRAQQGDTNLLPCI